MSNDVSSLSWLHGLQDYLKFSGDTEAKNYVDFLLGLMYSKNSPIHIKETFDMNEFIYHLKKYADNDIVSLIYKYYRLGYESNALQDAFSRGQVLSKIWLVTELFKIQKKFEMVHVHAGWFGQLRLYLDHMNIRYEKMRIFDIDPVANEVSDKVFNNMHLENYCVKSSIADVNDLSTLYRTGFEYPITDSKNEKTEADLIINTSAEHFQENWFLKYRQKPQSTDPLFIIQTNNLHSLPEHVNTIHNLEEMYKKYPMSRVEYSGELALQGYTRYMMIGRI
tara:strand:- start:1842 stop:2678 length:837 start_codon:yes stop_codon:yes gene_type:complete